MLRLVFVVALRGTSSLRSPVAHRRAGGPLSAVGTAGRRLPGARASSPPRALDVRPARGRAAAHAVLCDEPRVYHVRNLLSRDECKRLLASKAATSLTSSRPPEVQFDTSRLALLLPLLAAAPVPKIIRVAEIDGFAAAVSAGGEVLLAATLCAALLGLAVRAALGANVSKRRASAACQLDAELGSLVAQRVATLLKTDASHLEAPVLTRYLHGDRFDTHNDASATAHEWAHLGGQRVSTCIVYLNDVEHGGATYFDRLAIAVAPTAGDACVFFPSVATTRLPDARTTHCSQPAIDEKWIVQTFERERIVPPPLGLDTRTSPRRRANGRLGV
ncbi:hypothetical protein M885DRAFT_484621 [Pelagophyceae sp. CCMP2097]|nr:hypothetical protein M885DRAFT_484621 [Pelagophyceae sp. CCMP2097]